MLNAVKEHKRSTAATVDVRRRHNAVAAKLLGEVLLRRRVVNVGEPHTERWHAPPKPQLHANQ